MAKLNDTKQLTLEGAKAMGEAAIAEATKNGWGVAVAVVDAGGNPLYLARMETAPVASYIGASVEGVDCGHVRSLDQNAR